LLLALGCATLAAAAMGEEAGVGPPPALVPGQAPPLPKPGLLAEPRSSNQAGFPTVAKASAGEHKPNEPVRHPSLAMRIKIDVAELCQDYRVPKLARRRIAGARGRQAPGSGLGLIVAGEFSSSTLASPV